ncbi:MAG: cyclophilin family peptidyl-prolyl cis-trans isomerase [Halioglobus sp.]|jgi:cyclophilin family peptidyl-prolyl cis-trans isomerase
MLRAVLLCVSLFLSSFASAAETETQIETKAKSEPTNKNPIVMIKTSEGDITLQLNAAKAPITVANFLAYVDSGFYTDTIFHRVIPNFMIQGGGFNADMSKKKNNDAIVNESKNRLHNTRGSIAMARTNDPDSATSQFFINQRSNLQLDWAPNRPGYTVFGEVISGIKILDFIATAPTARTKGMADVPVKPILIKEIVRQ